MKTSEIISTISNEIVKQILLLAIENKEEELAVFLKSNNIYTRDEKSNLNVIEILAKHNHNNDFKNAIDLLVKSGAHINMLAYFYEVFGQREKTLECIEVGIGGEKAGIETLIINLIINGRKNLAIEYVESNDISINDLACYYAYCGDEVAAEDCVNKGINGKKANVSVLILGYVVGNHENLIKKLVEKNYISLDSLTCVYVVSGFKDEALKCVKDGINGHTANIDNVLTKLKNNGHEELAESFLNIAKASVSKSEDAPRYFSRSQKKIISPKPVLEKRSREDDSRDPSIKEKKVFERG